VPSRLLASSDAINGATEKESVHWQFGDTVTLRGHEEPTRLALPLKS
jgi:adenylate cyclase